MKVLLVGAGAIGRTALIEAIQRQNPDVIVTDCLDSVECKVELTPEPLPHIFRMVSDVKSGREQRRERRKKERRKKR